MRRGRRSCWALLLILASCAGDEAHPNDYTIAIEGPRASVAPLARLGLFVVDACAAPVRCTSGLCCTSQTIDRIVSAKVDPPIAVVTISGGDLELVPREAGDANLEVEAELGGVLVRETRAVRVREPDRLAIDGVRAHRPYGEQIGDACLPPALMQSGTRGYLPFRAYAGDELLVTSGWQPIALSGDAIRLGAVGGDATHGVVTFDAVRPGVATAATNVATPSSVSFEIIDASTIDGLRILPAPDFVLGRTERAEIGLVPLIGERDVCADTFARVVVIESPEVCAIDPVQSWPALDATETQATLPEGVRRIAIRAKSVGDCRVRGGLVGTPFGAVATMRVLGS